MSHIVYTVYLAVIILHLSDNQNKTISPASSFISLSINDQIFFSFEKTSFSEAKCNDLLTRYKQVFIKLFA